MQMMNNFEVLTKNIPKIKEDTFGKWGPEKQGAGKMEDPLQFSYVIFTELIHDFISDLYKFCEEHPEYEHTHYGDTLNAAGIEWGSDSMKTADVTNMDAKTVIALLIGAVRAERFCDGALLSFLNDGSITRWLERLKEIDEAE